jgi:hypothetical protein
VSRSLDDALAALRGWLGSAADEAMPAPAPPAATEPATGRLTERATALPSLADFLR